MKREFVWIWAAMGVLLLIIAAQAWMMYEFSAGLTDTQEQLEQARDQILTTLQALDSELETSSQRLATQINDSARELRGEILETDVSLRRRISGLEGKIGQVEQESRESLAELEEQVVSMNLKTQDFSLIIDDTLESVVSIFTDEGLGSGVIVTSECHLVTNYHIIEGISAAGARTYEGTVYPLRIIGTDSRHDLALLQLVTDEACDALDFEPASSVRVGTKVIALGSPAGFEFTVTEGIVSAIGRIDNSGTPVVQTDVPINPGNSGGPLLNIQGNIVGINTYKAAGFEGLGFAIQSDFVEEFVENSLI